MPGLYIDTSALARVMLGEPATAAITGLLADYQHHFSSRLLAVELRRAALRQGIPAVADALIGSIALVPLDETVLASAETITPAAIATLDALHLATAVRLAQAGLLTSVLTYDRRLATGARAHGLTPLAPG